MANHVFQRWIVVCLLSFVSTGGSPAAAKGKQEIVKIEGAYYLDSRRFTTASIGLSSSRLPYGFSLWGFTDFHGDHDSDDLALTRSFSEYRLSHSGLGTVTKITGLSFQLELNALSGSGNDLVRAGVTYKHDLRLPWLSGGSHQGWLQWRAFPYESDNDGGQASVVFYFPLSFRVHIQGFADYNINEGSDNRWVVEPELNVRLGRRLWMLLEYRYNQYEVANPATRGSSLALGLRYRFSG